jgi:predicted double-glycine peptidase
MRRRIWLRTAALVLTVGLFTGVGGEAAADTTVQMPNGFYFKKKVVSLKEARYKNMVRQEYDLSCGAASLATILKIYYEDGVDERRIIQYMLEHGDKEQISKKGFSLLDLKKYAEENNYAAAGYKGVKVEALQNLKVPAIVLLNTGRYSHFVVLKGVRDGIAYIADPAFGNRSMKVEAFEKDWNGVVFLVLAKDGSTPVGIPLESTLSAPQLSLVSVVPNGIINGFSFLHTYREF